ncbi:MAG: glycosyltransferase family 4 protein [Parcubacteria group bacterium]|nr:glycosyltransferase family 4 protein [Parcubacteria group bacterium]
MRIGIDARVLAEGNGGVFVYAKNLLEHLIPLAARHEIKLFANQASRADSPVLYSLAQHPNATVHQYRFPNKFLNASFRFKSWPKIDELVGGCDVLFFPSMMYAAWSPRTNTVLTMHDLSYEFFPEFFTYRQRVWHKLMDPRKLCERSDAVIAVSESTRQDVIARYRIPERKVTTIHSGIDSAFRPIRDRAVLARVRAKYGLPEGRYILQTGTLNPRKNCQATLAAFERLATRYSAEFSDVRLLCVGHAGWKSGGLLSAMRASAFSDRIHVIREVPASELPALYSLASVMAYPSFYEGFGFPVLEAFSCGIPVVASNTSSLGEIAQGSALLVNPHRVDELAAALREILNTPELARRLRSAGLLATVRFGWDKTAKLTLSVIEHAHRH